LAGINYDINYPGLQHFIIAPNTCGSLTSCRASYNSIYGKIISDWMIDNDHSFVIKLEIPANTSATLILPAKSLKQFIAKNSLISHFKSIKIQKFNDSKVILNVDSGKYVFTSVD
jgi:alpha-L-rhamnosidase